jgi:hypothetical protein
MNASGSTGSALPRRPLNDRITTQPRADRLANDGVGNLRIVFLLRLGCLETLPAHFQYLAKPVFQGFCDSVHFSLIARLLVVHGLLEDIVMVIQQL